MTNDLPDLHRRISRRLERGGGINLSREDLVLLVRCGAFKQLSDAVASQFEQRSELTDAAE